MLWNWLIWRDYLCDINMSNKHLMFNDVLRLVYILIMRFVKKKIKIK